jgi:hypothetical protein
LNGLLALCLARSVDVPILQKRFGSAVRVMPAVPVFVAQLLARFFLSAVCRFFEDRLANLPEGEGQAKRALSGLP